MHLASTYIDLGPSTSVTIALALIAALASIVAAIIAARSARSSKRLEVEAQRIRDLESSISDRKYKMYEPFLEHIANFFDYSEKGRQAVADPIANVEGFVTFAKQVTTYASDDAVEAYHKFNLATANNAPYPIVTRLMGDFLLAVRKDLSHPDTKVSGPILIATTFRVGDWYQQGEEFRKAMTLPLNQACKTLKWEPPWEYTDKTAVESPGSAKGDGSVDGGEGRSAGEGVDPEPLA